MALKLSTMEERTQERRRETYRAGTAPLRTKEGCERRIKYRMKEKDVLSTHKN